MDQQGNKMKLEVGKKYKLRDEPGCLYVEITTIDPDIIGDSCCATFHWKSDSKTMDLYKRNGKYWNDEQNHPKDIIAEYTEPNDKISQLKSCVDNLAKQIDEIKASLAKL